MSRQDVFEMPFEKVYQCLVQKAERKGRTQEEVDQVIKWLTGYVRMDFLPTAQIAAKRRLRRPY